MKRKLLSLGLLFGLFMPITAMAETNSIAQASGISDITLLVLMLSFIGLLLLIIQALSNAIKSISKSGKLEGQLKPTNTAKALVTLAFLGGSSLHAANESGAETVFVMDNTLFWILASLIAVLATIVFVLFRALQTLIKLQQGELVEESEVLKEEKTADIFESLSLTDNVPIEEEESVMLDHNYDGIKELDNNLPPLWVYPFLCHHHLFSGLHHPFPNYCRWKVKSRRIHGRDGSSRGRKS
jgi:hypothetical protein